MEMRKKRENSPLLATLIPRSWKDASEKVTFDSTAFPPPIALICGHGKSDKSAFSRFLLNTLLKRFKRVAYLDADVGQLEFSAEGCVALHIIDKKTPDLSILCMKKPERCIFFGHNSVKKDDKTYLSSIIFLFDHFRQEFYQTDEVDNPCKILLPLIINTSGWIKGAGYDMLVALLRHTCPTHVVKARFSSESKNLPNGLFWLDKTHRMPAILLQICSANEASYKPEIMTKELCILREIRIMAYFRQCLPMKMDFSNRNDLVNKLASVSANEIPLSKIMFKHNGSQILTNIISQGLNASIVGLAVRSSSVAENSSPWCIGLGIIRGVDYSKGQLYLLTPVHPSNLKNVDLVMQSTINIPICLQQLFLHEMRSKEAPQPREDKNIKARERIFSTRERSIRVRCQGSRVIPT